MRRFVPALLAGLALGACRAPLYPGWTQSLAVLGGEGSHGSGGWQGYGEPWLLAFEYSAQKDGWPCGIEVGAQAGQGDGPTLPQDRNSDLGELWVGASRVWCWGDHLRLHVGGGGRLLHISETRAGFLFSDEVDEDFSPGLYAHAGLYWRIAGTLSIGADARWADGLDLSIEGEHRDAALTQVLVGVRWDF